MPAFFMPKSSNEVTKIRFSLLAIAAFLLPLSYGLAQEKPQPQLESAWGYYVNEVSEGADLDQRLEILEWIEHKHLDKAIKLVEYERQSIQMIRDDRRAAREDPPVWDDTAPERRRGRHWPERGRPRFIPVIQLDYWSTADAFEKDKQGVEDFMQDIVVFTGYDSAVGKMDVTPGLGLRAGFFYPTQGNELLQLGGTIAYIWGPSATTEIVGRSGSFGDGNYTAEDDTSFVRVMGELLRIYPVNSFMDLKLRGGIGLARGHIRTKGSASGSFVSTLDFPSEFSASNSWTGFTWEFIPSLYFKGSYVNFEVGFGLAGFPKMKENSQYNEFTWTPVGLRFGIEF